MMLVFGEKGRRGTFLRPPRSRTNFFFLMAVTLFLGFEGPGKSGPSREGRFSRDSGLGTSPKLLPLLVELP